MGDLEQMNGALELARWGYVVSCAAKRREELVKELANMMQLLGKIH